MQTYVIDAFTTYSASGKPYAPFNLTYLDLNSRNHPTALAAVSFLRSLAGFGFPLFAPAMFKALCYGVGNTVLAAIATAIGCPACVTFLSKVQTKRYILTRDVCMARRIWWFWLYGKKIREMSKHAAKQ